jgi:hypothetical protein
MKESNNTKIQTKLNLCFFIVVAIAILGSCVKLSSNTSKTKQVYSKPAPATWPDDDFLPSDWDGIKDWQESELKVTTK